MLSISRRHSECFERVTAIIYCTIRYEYHKRITLFLVVECHQHMQLYNVDPRHFCAHAATHDSTQCAFLRLMVGECVQIGVFGCGLLGCSGLDVCKFIIVKILYFFVLNCTN